MIASLEEARRVEAPPWEPLARSYDGRGQFLRDKTEGGVRGRSGAKWTELPQAWEGAKSGLTRRGVVYEYVRGHPGNHVRAMARELGLATGDLNYHLFWLERNGFVKTRKSGFYRYVFPTMAFDEDQEVVLGVLSKETPREILLYLLKDASITQGELARSLGYSQPTVSWHLDRLVQLGLVSRARTSRGAAYDVVADRGDILGFVKSYHPGVWKRWAGRLAERSRPPQGARLVPPAVVEMIGKR